MPFGARYHNGRVYIGTKEYPGTDGNAYGGTLFCFDAENGALIWKTRTPGPGPDIQNYEKWQLMKSGTIYQSVVPVADGIVAFAGVYLIKYDYNGKILWRKAVHDNGSVSEGDHANPLVDNDLMYMANNGSGTRAFMFCFDLTNESLRWMQFMNPLGGSQTQGDGFPMQIDGSRIYKTTEAGLMIGFNKLTGVVEWASNLYYVLPKGRGYEDFLFGNIVEGDKVYFITAKHLVCAQRKK